MKNEITSHLKNQADAIRRGAELLIENINDWQIIKQFLTNRTNDLALTDTQQQKLNRYNFIYNQLASGSYTEHEVVTMTSKQQQISISQAYEDLACTKELFAVIMNFNRAFELHLQLSVNRMMSAKAQEKENFVAFALLEKNRVKMMSMLPEQEQQQNWFEPHENIIEFNPTLIGAEEVDMKQVLAYINDKRSAKIKTELFDEVQTIQDDDHTPALQ